MNRTEELTKALQAAKELFKCLLFIALIVFTVEMSMSMKQASNVLAQTTALVQNTNKHLNLTLTNVDRLVIIAGATATEAQKASKDERKYLATLNVQIARSLNDVHTTLQAATNTLRATQGSVAEVGPTLEAARTSIAALQPALKDLDQTVISVNKLVSDPNIPKTLANAESATAAVSATTEDVHEYIHKKFIEPLEKPVGWLRAGWKDILEGAYYARGILFP